MPVTLGSQAGFSRRPTKIPFFLIFFIVYLSISAAYLLLWRSYPLPSTLFFLALTAWHWGTADASLESSPTFSWLLFAISRGSLVMLAPFAFHLADTWSVILLMAPQAGPPPASLPFLPLLLIATLLNLFSRPSVHQTIETFLLLFLFYLTPPLLSVGTYFVAFHAWRHLLRLSALRDQLTPIDPIQGGPTPSANFSSSPSHSPLPASPFFAGFPLSSPSLSPKAKIGSALTLILLAVLTLPHALLVGWIDKRNITQL